MNVTIRCQSLMTMKTTLTDTSKYRSISKNNILLKDTVKSMQKAIYNANSINQLTNPLEYKRAWNNVFMWSNEFRKTIDIYTNELANELANAKDIPTFSTILESDLK